MQEAYFNTSPLKYNKNIANLPGIYYRVKILNSNHNTRETTEISLNKTMILIRNLYNWGQFSYSRPQNKL